MDPLAPPGAETGGRLESPERPELVTTASGKPRLEPAAKAPKQLAQTGGQSGAHPEDEAGGEGDEDQLPKGEREGLTLVTSGSTSTSYKGVTFYPKERGSKKYKLQVTVGGKRVFLGLFATAEQAALFYARREAGRDTSDLTAPPPPPPPSSTSAELPVYELSILTARRRGVWRQAHDYAAALAAAPVRAHKGGSGGDA